MASASTRISGLQLLLLLHPCSLWQPKAMAEAPHCSTAYCSLPAGPEIPQYSQEQKQKAKYCAVNKSKQNNQNYSSHHQAVTQTEDLGVLEGQDHLFAECPKTALRSLGKQLLSAEGSIPSLKCTQHWLLAKL